MINAFVHNIYHFRLNHFTRVFSEISSDSEDCLECLSQILQKLTIAMCELFRETFAYLPATRFLYLAHSHLFPVRCLVPSFDVNLLS